MQRVWALNKSAGPKNFLDIIFELIIARAKQMQLQILYQGFPREAKMKRISFELRMAKFFVIYRIYWPMSA